MFQFLAKINRGILLGVCMLIGLAVYFAVDARAFEGEAYDIRDVIVDFVEAVHDLNQEFTPEANRAFVDRFFTEYRKPYWHPVVSSVRQNVEISLEELTERPPEYQPPYIAFTLDEIYAVQKQATNAVSVRFTMDVNIRGADDGAMFFTGFVTGNSNRGNERIVVDAVLIRSGGEWRFVLARVRMANRMLLGLI